MVWKAGGMACRISAGTSSGPGALPLDMRCRQRRYLCIVIWPSSMDGARGGVGGSASAQGKGADGSTSGEGVREVVACSRMVLTTSAGSWTRVPQDVRIELREGRGAPEVAVVRRLSSWMTNFGFWRKSFVRVRE